MTIVVVGHFRLPAENVALARAAMERVVVATRSEDGCIAYAYAEDIIEPGLIRVTEVWSSRAALAAHFETPHMKNWQLERAEYGLSGREITAYTTSGAETL